MPTWLEFTMQPSWLAAWFWITLLITLIWLRRHFDLNQARHEPVLQPTDAGHDRAGLPRLSVLVAAKDEEANIAACLDGLIRQDYPGLQIIAINDRSNDQTGAIIDAYAAQHGQVTALHVGELPPDWFGKHHAMHLAQQHATGEYLCFTDADCRFHDSALLAASVRFASQRQIAMLSALPQLEAQTFWERVVQPPAGGIMVYWFPPDKVNNPDSSRAYANGAFILISRTAYDAIGGHAAVRRTLHEDMQLARNAKRGGWRLFVIRAGGMYSVRMYVGLRQIWCGWTRIFYGCFASVPRLLLSIAFLLVFSLSPYATVLFGRLAGPPGHVLLTVGAAAIIVQQSVLWRFYRLCGMHPAWAVTYPLGAALSIGMMLNALRRHFGARTEWRGTSYTGGA